MSSNSIPPYKKPSIENNQKICFICTRKYVFNLQPSVINKESYFLCKKCLEECNKRVAHTSHEGVSAWIKGHNN